MCFRPNDVSVAEQPLVCPACNRENAPGETTCVFCGADLPAEGAGGPYGAGAPPAIRPAAAPSRPETPGASPAPAQPPASSGRPAAGGPPATP